MHEYKQCAGKGCENEGKIVLVVQYLKRTVASADLVPKTCYALGLPLDMKMRGPVYRRWYGHDSK